MPVTVTPGSYNLPVIPREDLEQDANKLFEIPPRTLFVFDSGAVLPAAGASDDLGFYQGTHGTNFPYVGTGDIKTLGATTRKARFTFTLPPEYVSDGALFIRFKAGMVTTVADTSCTIDAAAFKASATAGGVITGADRVSTSATSINSLTWDDIDFALDQSGFVAGDEIDVLVTIAGVDAASGTAVIGAFRAFVGCTIRG